jgi:triosephosphate isomerase (TIM)
MKSAHNSKKLLVGNWKMGPASPKEARRILGGVKRWAKKLPHARVVVCPPFVYSSLLKNSETIELGAQDVHFEQAGAFTGEISPSMLANIGVTYVIVGHSERRAMGETDEIVAKKVSAVVKSGLTAIVCVGERIRDPQGEYLGYLKDEIKNSLAKIQKKNLNNLIIAYEPIWEIGAVEAMNVGQVHEMVIFVKKVLSDMFGHDEAARVPILYGGSVNFRNAGDIVRLGNVDGLLVGRESVNLPGFVEIMKAIDALK